MARISSAQMPVSLSKHLQVQAQYPSHLLPVPSLDGELAPVALHEEQQPLGAFDHPALAPRETHLGGEGLGPGEGHPWKTRTQRHNEECEAQRSRDSPRAAYFEHRVSRLDTLAGLAVKYGVEVEQLKRLNRLTSDLQLFARDVVRIPISSSQVSPPECPSPPVPAIRAGTASSQHRHSVSTEDLKSPVGTSGQGSARGAAAAAAAVAAGREAAAAAVQLVENVDPELLLGVKGLRTAKEAESVLEGVGQEQQGSTGGRDSSASAAALLLALQRESGGIGLHDANPLRRLALSSASSAAGALGEGRRVVWGPTSSGGRRSAPLPEHAWQHDGGQCRGQGLQSTSFWEHEFDGEDEPRSHLAEGQRPGDEQMQSSAVNSMSDSSLPALVGLWGEKLTMRRRSQGRPGDRGTQGEGSGGVSSGEEQELGWLSADEYIIGKTDAAKLGANAGGTSSFASVQGWAVPSRGGARDKAWGVNIGPVAWLRAGGTSCVEPLDSRTTASSVPVATAGPWGNRVLDDLFLQLRRSGVWLLDRSAREGFSAPTNAAAATTTTTATGAGYSAICTSGKHPTFGRGCETGIDLAVMSRGENPSAPSRSSTLVQSGEALVGEGSPWSLGPAAATFRRGSKGKAAMD